MTRLRCVLIFGLVVLAAACGGSDSGDQATAAENTATTPSIASSPSSTAASSGESDAAASGAAVPIARFAAHGPQAENTIGPACADGIDTRGGDVFRFTPPSTWEWQGRSGGSGSDEVKVNADGVEMYVRTSAHDYDTVALPGWEVTGPAGVDLDIDGESIPMMEIMLDGAPGYAIVDLPYLGPVPSLPGGEALGTVALTSAADGRPTIDEATELLSSVRVERCAAVGLALIWGPVGRVHFVPRFEPDPLGKTYPDQPQPEFDPSTTALEAYTLEQIAYLLPVADDISACAAERAQEYAEGNPIAHLQMLTPTGTAKDDAAAVIADC